MAQDSNKTIKVGVIGLGYWGPNLVRVFNQQRESRVILGCDLKPGRREYIAARFPQTRVTENYLEVIEDREIDLVCIATAMDSHYQLAREAITAGKHVLVEKPFTSNVREAEDLLQLAKSHGRIIFVDHIFLYSPAIESLKRILNDGIIGDIFYITATRINPGPPGARLNVLWDLGPHDISIALYLLDAIPSTVSAHGSKFQRSTVEDVISLVMEFNDGRFVQIHNSWLSPNKTRRMEIFGSRGYILYDDTQMIEKLRVYGQGVDNRLKADENSDQGFSYQAGDIFIPHVENNEPMSIQAAHIVRCLAHGEAPRSGAQSGLQVIRTIEEAQKALQRNLHEHPFGGDCSWNAAATIGVEGGLADPSYPGCR